MSDSATPHPSSPDPAKSASWDAASEQDLDAALDKAAALASDLSADLGRGKAEARTSLPELLEDPRKNLDQQLEELDVLLETTSAEVAPTPAPAVDAVPDFMSEFTMPSSSPPGAGAVTALQSAPVAVPAPGAVAAKTAVIGGAIGKASAAKRGPADAESVAGPATDSGVSRALAAAFSPVVALLELADRPLQSVGPRVRRLAGWVAVALLFAAVVVHFVSAK